MKLINVDPDPLSASPFRPPNFSCSTKCTAWNGRIIVIGFAKGTFEKIPTNRILLKNISVV